MSGRRQPPSSTCERQPPARPTPGKPPARRGPPTDDHARQSATTPTHGGDRVHTPITAARVTITTSPSPSGCRRPVALARRTLGSSKPCRSTHQPVPLGPRCLPLEAARLGAPSSALVPPAVLGCDLAVVAAWPHVVGPRHRRIPDGGAGRARPAGRRCSAAIGRAVYLGAVVRQRRAVDDRRRDRSAASDARAGCVVARLLARVRVAGRRCVVGRRRCAGCGEPDLRARPVLSHTVTSPRSASSLAGPMPRTSPSCSTVWNGPFCSRWATIAAAVVGPTPGSTSS